MLTGISDRNEFGALLNDLGLTDCAIEIGVHRGEFTKPFLDTWKGKMMWLIDPWETMDDYTDILNQGDRNEDYQACRAVLMPHIGRYSFLKSTSELAVPHFRDGMFSFIYIDGNHEEAFVRQDLDLWYPKLARGGIFAGHDYCSTVTWPGVRRAVNDFAEKLGVTISTTNEPGGSWYWIKP